MGVSTASEPFHTVTDIKKECATLLFAVVTNIYAGGDLAADRYDNRFAPGRFELAVRDGFVTALSDVQTAQCVGRGRLPVCVTRIRSVLAFMN